MSTIPEIREIKNIDDLIAIRHEWDEYIEKLEFQAPFLLYENYYSWWKNFGHEASPLILVLQSNREIVCIMPLLQYSITLFGHTFKILKLMRNEHSFYDDIVYNGDGEPIHSALNRYMEHNRIALIDFEPLPIDSRFFNSLRESEVFEKKVYLYEGEIIFGGPYIDIEGTLDTYWNTLSSKLRQNLRRTEKALQVTGNIDIYEARGADTITESLLESFRIESLSWKADEGTAIVCNEIVKNYYMNFFELIAKKGLLHIYFLEINNKKIAFDLSMERKGVLYGIKTGYDQEYSKYSPGLLLRKRIIEILFSEQKITTYNMMGLVDEWKLKWTQKKNAFKRYILFRKNIISLIIAIKAGYGKIFAKYLLQRLKGTFSK